MRLGVEYDWYSLYEGLSDQDVFHSVRMDGYVMANGNRLPVFDILSISFYIHSDTVFNSRLTVMLSYASIRAMSGTPTHPPSPSGRSPRDDARSPALAPQAAEWGAGGEVELSPGTQRARLRPHLPDLHPKVAPLRVNALQSQGESTRPSEVGPWGDATSSGSLRCVER